MPDKPTIRYDYPVFEAHSVSKGGFLPDFEKGAHACWYYCQCAHLNLQSEIDGAVYEGEQDTIEALNNIARSVAIMYQLESPDDFLKFMPVVLKEAERVGLGYDPKVLAPWLSEFKRTMA